MNTKTLLILAVIIIVITGVTLFWEGRGDAPGSVDHSSGLIISKSAIYVADQLPGLHVSVSVVHLEKPGFVVIHEDMSDAPGKILGESSLLSAGETENLLPITLSRAARDGEIMYAMLHVDNGDGAFDAADDKPVLDSMDGAPMMTIFMVSKDVVEPGVVNP